MRYAIIGDVHGCIKEFSILLNNLLDVDTIISVGDLTDKGPNSNECLELAAEEGIILVDSNHDEKYAKFVKKNRVASTIENTSRRHIYESLSQKAKNYLLTARPFFRGEYYLAGELTQFVVVHGGIGPNHTLFPINPKTWNEMLRLRYVDKDTLEKVSTQHNLDGTWGPEHDNVWKWQEVYHGQFGPVIHGHIVEKMGEAVYWENGKQVSQLKQLVNPNSIVSIDGGCVYGGALIAAVIEPDGAISTRKVTALKEYTK